MRRRRRADSAAVRPTWSRASNAVFRQSTGVTVRPCPGAYLQAAEHPSNHGATTHAPATPHPAVRRCRHVLGRTGSAGPGAATVRQVRRGRPAAREARRHRGAGGRGAGRRAPCAAERPSAGDPGLPLARSDPRQQGLLDALQPGRPTQAISHAAGRASTPARPSLIFDPSG
jgi:hypothetical protein